MAAGLVARRLGDLTQRTVHKVLEVKEKEASEALTAITKMEIL